MYVPAHFDAGDADELIARLIHRSAATLITVGADGAPRASHLPVVWDAEQKIVTGHIARANPQWKDGRGQGLVILSGAQAYISPSWYPSKAEHGKAVPTWNYESVHIAGRVEWFDDPARLRAVVRDLSALHEAYREHAWSIDDAPESYIETMLRGIVGVVLHAERIDAKRKLSQNKPEADYNGVMQGLRREHDAQSREVADLMKAAQIKSE